MLFDIISQARYGELTMQFIVVTVFAYAVVLLLATPIHECAHAFVAKLLGDDTAFYSGRVTLNPVSHFDLIGTLGILIVGIGWAKPVPVNPTRARKVSARTAMALTAAAGPVSNVLFSFVLMIIVRLVSLFADTGNMETIYYICYAVMLAASINVSLAIFNLLPIPPFDGSRVVYVFLSEKSYFAIMKYEQIIMIAVLLICFTGILSGPLSFLNNAVMKFLAFATGFIPGNDMVLAMLGLS